MWKWENVDWKLFFFFQEQSQHFFIQKSILKSKVSLCDRGKSGKQTFFYFGLSLCYIFGSNHAKVFLNMVFLKSKRKIRKIPAKTRRSSLLVMLQLQTCMFWTLKFSLNIFKELFGCFSLWLCYIWFLRWIINEWLYEDMQFCFVFVIQKNEFIYSFVYLSML